MSFGRGGHTRCGIIQVSFQKPLSLNGTRHCEVGVRIPTILPFALQNGVVQSIEACVGDHGVTFKHYCHEI